LGSVDLKKRFARKVVIILAILALTYLLLLIPGAAVPKPQAAGKRPFIWNQDAYWSSLEASFLNSRNKSQATLENQIEIEAMILDSLITGISRRDSIGPDYSGFGSIESAMFELGAKVAACTNKLSVYIELFSKLRKVVKYQSRSWDMNSSAARDRIYRLIYGGRAAVEEIMLQAPDDSIPALIIESDAPSMTPAALMLGVTIHSGDILVSRGGAPTSALIARGNDYPGNFSHVALVYVDEKTGAISIIESHIERGVTVSPPEKYLKDTKLRVMVLRLRSDLSALITDPMLPHKVASLALNRALEGHIPYDFEMNFKDHRKLFCSEVASAPYSDLGIRLWMGLSNISGRGISSWLSGFGVTHFETQEPSDLEYDPQLSVVAEWRDPETLQKDHIDNAVIDAMLEEADGGKQLAFAWYMLPFARVMKIYSLALNYFDKVGPVPEGMNSQSALQHKWFAARHAEIKKNVVYKAAEFKRLNGYFPPYWELVKIARQCVGLGSPNNNVQGGSLQ
jgi:hypothetical protein